jgi:hypothetical protein
MEHDFIKAIVAALAASLLGHVIVRKIMDYLWEKFLALPDAKKSVDPNNLFNEVKIFSKWLGVIERIVYAASWILGGEEVIVAILVIKAQPSLKEWSENTILGRNQFNIWLIGNLSSVIVSISCAEIVKIIFK